jgi:response regulator of citrate/malate metabolism
MSFSERKHKMAKKRKVSKKKKVVKSKAKKKKAAKRKKAPRGLWSKADVSLLRKLFPANPTSKIAKKLGRKTDAVKKKASRMGLRKSKRYLKSIGRA